MVAGARWTWPNAKVRTLNTMSAAQAVAISAIKTNAHERPQVMAVSSTGTPAAQ